MSNWKWTAENSGERTTVRCERQIAAVRIGRTANGEGVAET